MSEFWLSEEQFERLRPLLPNNVRGVTRVDDRRGDQWTTGAVISGIIHVVRSGGRWVDAPACYGPRKTLHNRFVRWAANGRIQWEVISVTSSNGLRPSDSSTSMPLVMVDPALEGVSDAGGYVGAGSFPALTSSIHACAVASSP